MALKNYTTSVPVSQTVSDIHKELAAHGARKVMFDYDDSGRGISFIEADGGMWKLTARETIKKFLEEQLQQEVGEGSVIIAL